MPRRATLHNAHRLIALAIAAGVVAASCSDSATSDEAGNDTSVGGMTIAQLCDTIEDQVLGFTGPGAKPDHGDLFADDSEMPSLVCAWYDSSTTRELRVVYHGSPSVWEATVTEGKDVLDAIEADNVYEVGSLDIHAPNGWTISVYGWEGSTPARTDAPEALATIGNAALRAIGP